MTLRIFFFALAFLLGGLTASSQTIKKSKIVLNNNDVITGRIIEVVPGEYFKIEIIASNVITIPYNDVRVIYMDENNTVSETPAESAPSTPKTPSTGSLADFYFESNNEVALNIGIGKVYGLPAIFDGMKVLNNAVGGGFYTANGIGYKGQYFLGIGLGFYSYSHSEYGTDKKESYYSIPYMLDMRYRVFRDKKFSPIAMFGIGAEYIKGGMGTFTFMDGIGLSIKFRESLSANFIIDHTMVRYMPNLSLENGPAEDILGNTYFNFIGARLGLSFKL